MNDAPGNEESKCRVKNSAQQDRDRKQSIFSRLKVDGNRASMDKSFGDYDEKQDINRRRCDVHPEIGHHPPIEDDEKQETNQPVCNFDCSIHQQVNLSLEPRFTLEIYVKRHGFLTLRTFSQENVLFCVICIGSDKNTYKLRIVEGPQLHNGAYK